MLNNNTSSSFNFKFLMNVLLIFLFSIMLFQSGFAQEKRVALVIGNSAYPESPLKNPVNDAKDIAQALEKIGFKVEVATNQSHEQIVEKLQYFDEQLNKADVGFFYYAGHGVQAEGVNYLIPVSSNLSDQNTIINEAISISSILQKMELAGNGINIVVLDACRNNPFSKRFDTKQDKGLAVIKAPSASFIAYATAPGSVAADGSGNNGLYTQYLLKNISTPNQSIEQMFKKVRVAVVNDSEGLQVPWENSSLLGEFQFVEALYSEEKNIVETDKFELDFWNTIQKDPSAELYKAYLKKFPQGTFVLMAQEKLKKLGNGMITIHSNVFGDSIKINGEYRGSSKSTYSLEPDKYTIELSKIGFETVRKTVRVEAGKHLELKFSLQASHNVVNNSRSTQMKHEEKHSKDVKVLLPEPALIKNIINDELSPIVAQSNDFQVTAEHGDSAHQEPLNEKIESIVGMSFVQIKSDCFTMGSPTLEEGRLNDEKKHKVCLSKDFWIGKYEVTQAQWQKVMGHNPAFFKGCGGNCPVERVSWDEVQEFITKLNQQTGQNYRLPTEAEWEYAARAGNQGSTYLGNAELLGQNNATYLNQIAWYSGNSGIQYKGGRYCEDWDEKEFPAIRCGTHTVGEKQANSWQLYDMLGNVWEWTNDKYGSLSTQEAMDPQGAKTGNKRVVKGGNWKDTLAQNRSAARYGFTQNKKMEHVGFRLVRNVD